MPRKEMTGTIWEKLTVLGMEGVDNRGETLWKCKCECGRETVVLGGNLRSGHTRSCGKCTPKRQRTIDIVGETFGVFTVVEEIEPNKFNHRFFLCRCNRCGNTMVKDLEIRTHKNERCDKCHPNIRYEIRDDITEGVCSDGTRFIFSTYHLPTVKKYGWYIRNGYITANIGEKKNQKQLFLHKLIKPCEKPYVTDHIDGNPLNCTDENLRVCRNIENTWNHKLYSHNTSGFNGVSYNSRERKYVARIRFCDRLIHLGYYETAYEAAQARFVADMYLLGEYSREQEQEDMSMPDSEVIMYVRRRCGEYMYLKERYLEKKAEHGNDEKAGEV